MRPVFLKDLSVGDYFRFKDSEKSPLWIRGTFVRFDNCKKFSCISYDDSCKEVFRKGSSIVFVEDYI